MVRFRAPASVVLRRAQLVLMLAALVPTVLLTGLGIVLLAVGSSSVTVVAGVLVLAFCTSALTGYILSSIFVSRGVSLTRLQSDFISSVSHEIRTPLTSIQMFIETLREDRVTDPVERAKCLAIVHGELRRLDGLVTKLLDLSRLESGRHDYERLPIAVKELVAEAVGAFQAASLGSKVALEVDTPADLRVIGDRAALILALGNLITNAWKYGESSDPRIRVIARPQGARHVEIEVADNGPGVALEERQRIFEQFERGQAATATRIGGSGLGLAIVRAIVRAHRGRVDVASKPGEGARFSVRLPRAKELTTA